MKNKIFKLMMDLQLFAEGDGTGAGDTGNGAENTVGEGTVVAGTERSETTPSSEKSNAELFNEFLKQPGMQAEFDRSVGKALETREKNLRDEFSRTINGAREEGMAEGKRLASMSAKEKEEYEKRQAQKHVEDIEKENAELKKWKAMSEMSSEASKILREDHSITATQDMLDFVVTDNAESTKENIEKLVRIITNDRKQVEAARATGRTPKSYGGNNPSVSEIDKRIAKYKH